MSGPSPTNTTFTKLTDIDGGRGLRLPASAAAALGVDDRQEVEVVEMSDGSLVIRRHAAEDELAAEDERAAAARQVMDDHRDVLEKLADDPDARRKADILDDIMRRRHSLLARLAK